MKLVFYFPWPEVSGGPFYLTRIANAIAETKEYDVYYVDYKGGLANTLLKNKDIEVLIYDNEGKKYTIFKDEPIVLVMVIYWAHMVPIMHPDSKVVFLNWHNCCIPVLKGDWHCTTRFVNKFLELVRDTSSVFFLDKTHLLAQNTDTIKFKEQYVPITIPERDKTVNQEIVKEKERNIAVLGRLVLDKIFAVTDLVDNIIASRDNVNTNIYVIGEGDCQDMLFNKKLPSYIKLIKCKTMDIEKIIDLFCKKVDILFAMGTSVLDGASVKLPSVIIPNDTVPFSCNKYSYLYESEGYALGWGPDQIDELDIETHTVAEILDDIYVKGKKKEIGDKCYEYYVENHTSNLDMFRDAIAASTMTRQKYVDFTRRTFNGKLFLWTVKYIYEKFRGGIIYEIKLFGFPIYTYAATSGVNKNIFLFGLPFIRIVQYGGSRSFHFLPAVWAFTGLKKLIGKLKK